LFNRLFGYTSMDKLVLSTDERMDPFKEALHITFDLNSNEWHFNYFALPFKDPEFVRIYSVEKGIEKFDNFVKMIGWSSTGAIFSSYTQDSEVTLDKTQGRFMRCQKYPL